MMIPVGQGQYVSREAVVAILPYAGAPVERMVHEAREKGRLIDGTRGRRTRSVIRLLNRDLVLSSLTTETIARRLGGVG